MSSKIFYKTFQQILRPYLDLFGFLVHLSSCFISGQAYYIKNIFPKQVLRKQAARGRSSVGEYW